MKTNKNIQNEIEGISKDAGVKLESLKKDNPLEVPFNYFDEMQDAVFQQLENEKPAPKGTGLWEQMKHTMSTLFRPQPAIAFATIALLVGGFFFANNKSDEVQQDLLANIDDTTLENLIELNLESFENEEIFDLVENEDFLNIIPDNTQNDEYIDGLLEHLDEDEISNLF